MATEPRKLPTKEEWAEIKERLSGVWGCVDLLIDGYQVSLHRGQVSTNTLGIAMYVDGWSKGEWFVFYDEDTPKELPEITKRFCATRKKAKYGAKHVKDMEKILGKRKCKKNGWYKKQISHEPWWRTAGPMIAHFKKHNHNIEYFPDSFPKEAV